MKIGDKFVVAIIGVGQQTVTVVAHRTLQDFDMFFDERGNMLLVKSVKNDLPETMWNRPFFIVELEQPCSS